MMSRTWLALASSNAWAVPANLPWMVGGRSISRPASWISLTAVSSENPGSRLNEIVTAGNWPWWGTDRAVRDVDGVATCSSRTSDPVLDLTYRWLRPSGFCVSHGSASMTTRYWFRDV